MKKNDPLTIKEMQTLKGGEDVLNKNTFNGCICFYNDTGAISNENTIGGCQCQCTKPTLKTD